MEENVGRERQGRPSHAHSSARREAAAIALSKRGRHRQGTPPVQGMHDNEVGSSAAGGSQRRSGRVQVQEPGPEVEDEGQDDGDVVVEAVQPREAPQEGYGGGQMDMSLLHAYHKHRAISIWDARSSEDMV
ncbi:hypothetical protein A2U01_0033317 [Trifolium medium]|uniref:Uncharacterized protein n=1 Tax=Trifolium medium TaxID=97028 RepID=A0A392PK70_9FABA|nr:hypothetical protein [Trifolium medium]